VKVAIIGSGLIGGSVGLKLMSSGDHQVVVYDRDPEAAGRAVAIGAATRSASTAAEAIDGSEVVFLATPVGALEPLVRELRGSLLPGQVLTDVGSTKSRVVVEIEESIPEGVNFVGGHPMAGKEDHGIEAADGSLFDGAWWILTPTSATDHAAYRLVHSLVTTLGARVMALTPQEHDELLALISHVPQITATALMTQAAERGREHAGLLALAAGGFRDVTRVAASNPEIWLDVCRENRDSIVLALRAFTERLSAIGDLIEAGDREQLGLLFAEGRRARRSLPGKQVAGDLFAVRMPIPDRPGVLAEVTTTVGNLGVNIEDLEISHEAEGGRGALMLAINGRVDADRAAEALDRRGYQAKVELI